jgi:hypothetical protein
MIENGATWDQKKFIERVRLMHSALFINKH